MPLSATARSTRSCFLPALSALYRLLPCCLLFSPCSGIYQSRCANGADQVWNFVGSQSSSFESFAARLYTTETQVTGLQQVPVLAGGSGDSTPPPPPNTPPSPPPPTRSLLSLPRFLTLYSSETTARCPVQVLAGGSAASTSNPHSPHPPTHLFSPSLPFSPLLFPLSLCPPLSFPPSFPAPPLPPRLR